MVKHLFKKGEQNWKLRKDFKQKGTTKAEHLKGYIAKHKAEITNDALISLAQSKVFKGMKKAKTLKDIKDLCLPIALKGIADKTDLLANGKRIDIFQYIANQNIANVSPPSTIKGRVVTEKSNNIYIPVRDTVPEEEKANVTVKEGETPPTPPTPPTSS